MIFYGGCDRVHAETDNDVAGANRPHFVVLQGPGLGDFFEITDDELILGSDPFRADIVVRDVEVEPQHACYKDRGTREGRGSTEASALNGESWMRPGAASPTTGRIPWATVLDSRTG